MRPLSFVLCTLLLAGCANHGAVPVASATTAAPLSPDQSIEVRHVYLFAPGKNPVLVVQRDDASSTAQAISSEPPGLR